MQGPLTNIFTCYNKVEAFLKKLDLWIKRIQENTYDMFPSYYNMTEEKLLRKNEINIMQCLIKTHLSKIKK